MEQLERTECLPVSEQKKSVKNGKQKNDKLRKKLKKKWQFYVMMIPIIAFLLVFSYYPMYGIVLAFKDYMPSKGIWGSEWIGFDHFKALFALPDFPRAFRNTLIISFLSLVFCFPAPILLALLLNEIKVKWFKKFTQTAIYLPNFISWVIIAGIVNSLLSYSSGAVNNILESFGLSRVEFLTEPKYFYPILILSQIWRDAGWGTIIYIAAISSIDPSLYEAAQIDGCKRLKATWYITLPSIMPIIIIMFVQAVGNVLNSNFDAIFNLYNPTTYEVADVIDTLVYRTGIDKGEFERATAIGLFKTVINFILLMSANKIVKKINGYGIYEVAE